MASNAVQAASESHDAYEESVYPPCPDGWSWKIAGGEVVGATYDPSAAGATLQPTASNIPPPAVLTSFGKKEVDVAMAMLELNTERINSTNERPMKTRPLTGLEQKEHEYYHAYPSRVRWYEAPPPPPPSPVPFSAHSPPVAAAAAPQTASMAPESQSQTATHNRDTVVHQTIHNNPTFNIGTAIFPGASSTGNGSSSVSTSQKPVKPRTPLPSSRPGSGSVSTSQKPVKPRTALPSSRPKKPMSPTQPRSPDHPGRKPQAPTATQNEGSSVTPPSRKSAAAPTPRREKKPQCQWITPEPFQKTEEELRNAYQEKWGKEPRCNNDWAANFYEGQSTVLGLKRGEYPKLDVPGKKKHPGAITKKNVGQVGKAVGLKAEKKIMVPTAAFAIYAVLAKVPGGRMTLENIQQTVEEWLPNLPNEKGNPHTFEDQTYRAALTRPPINKPHIFGHNGAHLWCILGANENKGHYDPTSGEYRGGEPRGNSPSASSSSTNSSQDKRASSSSPADSPRTTPEDGPIPKRKNEGHSLESEGPPPKKQRTKS